MIIFLFSCQKKEEVPINVTDEIDKIEGYIANYDKTKEELKKGSNEQETRASDAYIAKITEEIVKQNDEYLSRPKFKYLGYRVGGVLETSGGCGGRNEIIFHLDCEDGNTDTKVSPLNVIASNRDGYYNFNLMICAVDLDLFHRMPNIEYALLRFGSEVPAGLGYFIRHFDTEDNNPQNDILFNGYSIYGNPSLIYLYEPNVVNNNMDLWYYFFARDQNSQYTTFPNLNISYAVFGNMPNGTKGYLYTNDEDHNNADEIYYWEWDDVNHYLKPMVSGSGASSRLTTIGRFGVNTQLYWTLVY